MGTKSEAIAKIINADDPDRKIVIRYCGTDNILIELGQEKLDFMYRVRLYWMEYIIRKLNIRGLIDISPGVRSALITYDGLNISLETLLEIITIAEKEARNLEYEPIPSRRVILPIAFHDSKTRNYIQKYMEHVRSQAPYLPDNMEFVARCNGLKGIQEVEEYFLRTEHMVMGLGDVYLGAPCAVPLDPRYRMSAPKYNPARTMTPEGAVGIGGSFMCIYPMESPGGYQLIGRTVPFWDTWQTNDAFKEAPWLLRPFDRIQFEAVSEPELDDMAKGVHSNQYHFKIDKSTFCMDEYTAYVASVETEAKAFLEQQAAATKIATEGY